MLTLHWNTIWRYQTVTDVLRPLPGTEGTPQNNHLFFSGIYIQTGTKLMFSVDSENVAYFLLSFFLMTLTKI